MTHNTDYVGLFVVITFLKWFTTQQIMLIQLQNKHKKVAKKAIKLHKLNSKAKEEKCAFQLLHFKSVLIFARTFYNYTVPRN